MLGYFKKSASILTDQETQMVGNDQRPATICNTEKSLLFQVREKALIAIVSGFQMPRHMTYLSNCLYVNSNSKV